MGIWDLKKVKSYEIIYSEKREAYFSKNVIGFWQWSGSKWVYGHELKWNQWGWLYVLVFPIPPTPFSCSCPSTTKEMDGFSKVRVWWGGTSSEMERKRDKGVKSYRNNDPQNSRQITGPDKHRTPVPSLIFICLLNTTTIFGFFCYYFFAVFRSFIWLSDLSFQHNVLLEENTTSYFTFVSSWE